MSAPDSREHEIDSKTKRVRLFGVTSAGEILPVKVVDDGNGYGKLSCSVE